MRLLLLTSIVVAALFHLGENADANRFNSRYAAPISYQPKESEALQRTGQVAECIRLILRNHRGLRMARSADSPTSVVECLKLMVRGQKSNATQVLQLKKEVRVEKTIRAEVNPKRKQKCIHRVLVPSDNSGYQKQTDSSDIYGQKTQATSKTGQAANKVETQGVRLPDDGVRVLAQAPQSAEARISAGPEQHQGRDVPASAESHEDPDESGEFVNDEEHQDSDEKLQTPVKPVAGQRPKLEAADQVKYIPVQVKSEPDTTVDNPSKVKVIDGRQSEQHPAAQTEGELVQGRDVPASAESNEDPDESGELVNEEEHQDSDEQLQTPVKPVADQPPKLEAANQVKSISVQAKSELDTATDKSSEVIDGRLFDQKSASPEQHPAAQTKGGDFPASAESHEDPDESGELVNEEEHQDSDEQLQTLVKPVADQPPKLEAANQVKSILAVAVKDPKIGHDQHGSTAAAFRLAAAGQVDSSKIVDDVKGASAESKEEIHSAESGEVKQDPDESQESAENVQADDQSAERKIDQEHHDEHKLAAHQVHSAENDGSHEAADESAGQSAEEAYSKDETVAQQQPAPSDRVSEQHQSAEDRSTEADDAASGEERGESVEESDRSKEAADDQEKPQHHEVVEAVKDHKPAAADQVYSAEDDGSHEAADDSSGSSVEEADSKQSNDETVEQHTAQVAQQQPVPSSDRVSEEHQSAEDRSTEADDVASGEERGESVEESDRSKEAADQGETPHSDRPSEEHKSAEETESTETHDESSREEHGGSAEEPAPHATRASKDSVERVDQQSGEDHSKEATHDTAKSEERSESGEETGPSREAADSQEHDAASSGSHSAKKASPPVPQMSKEPASAEESNQESAEGAHDDSSQDEALSEEHGRVVQGQAKLKEVVPLQGQSAEEHKVDEKPDQKQARKQDDPEALHGVEERHSALSAVSKSIKMENLKEQLSDSFGTSAETIEDERSVEDPEEQSHEFRTGLHSDEEASTEGHSVIGATENDKPPPVKPVHRYGSSEHSAEVAEPVAVQPTTSSAKQMAHIQEPVPLMLR